MCEKMGFDSTKSRIIAGIWDDSEENTMTCPQCGGDLIVTQVNPIDDWKNPFQSYDTTIECSHCPFQTRATSFTMLGNVRDFGVKNISIDSWSPSGSRVISEFEHLIDYSLLKNLKTTDEIVEFLVIDNQVVKIIE
jgi:hypothetical protein